MPPKKKTKKLIKLKKRVPATTINIKIDNSRRTQARKPAENKPKGHVNLPITYFSQFQPARTVITDQRPNQGFNTTDMYQSQFKNYFDGKLDDIEKRILEQSEKKNTAPPRPEEKPGAYSRVSDYDDNLIMENRKPKAPPPNRTNIVSNSNLEDNPFIISGWKPNPKPATTITEADPIDAFNSAIFTVEPFDEIEFRKQTITDNKNEENEMNEMLKEELQTRIINARQKQVDENPLYKLKPYENLENKTIKQLETVYKQTYKPPEYFEEQKRKYVEKQNKQPGQKGRPKKNNK